MLLSKKFEEVKNNLVTVLDPHFEGGFPVATKVHELKDKDGKVVNHVALDMYGQFHGVVCKNDMLWFDNTSSYGSIGKARNTVEGWCYDRDGYTIDGFTSTGYYKESTVA